jgi:hypothetical protein
MKGKLMYFADMFNLVNFKETLGPYHIQILARIEIKLIDI